MNVADYLDATISNVTQTWETLTEQDVFPLFGQLREDTPQANAQAVAAIRERRPDLAQEAVKVAAWIDQLAERKRTR